MPRPSREEIRRAVRRLDGERLETVGELAVPAGHPAATLRRWVVSGCRGVRLDGFHRPGVGWLSSWPAYLRFCRALADLEWDDGDRLAGLARRGVAPGDASAGVFTSPPERPDAAHRDDVGNRRGTRPRKRA